MKFVYISISIIILIALFYFAYLLYFAASFSSGLGGGRTYKFDCERQELYSCLKSFYIKNKNYNVPSKWKDLDLSTQHGYNELDGISFYFNSNANEPEEMYFVSLIKDELSDTTFTKPSYLAIRTVFPNNSVGEKLSNKEKERTDNRFKNYILDKFQLDSCNCRIMN